MHAFVSFFRKSLMGIAAGGTIALASVSSGFAAPVSLPFDPTSGSPTFSGAVLGTSGHLAFTLNVDVGVTDPSLSNVFGSFSMDIIGPGNAVLGQVSMLGQPFFDGASQDLGDAAAGPFGGLPLVTTWFFDVTSPAVLPILLQTTSQLDSPTPFIASLTVEATGGDLQVVTPIPGSMALFASGIGVLGWIGSRRRRTHAANAA